MPLNRIMNKLTWDYNKKQIKSVMPLVESINDIYESRHDLSNEEIQAKTGELRERLSAWETMDDILPEAFATVKQACRRLVGQIFPTKWEEATWNMIPYDVQLIGGIMLHKWHVAEMRTGEGKTLVATLPTYLNALTGKWVHVVTVNDYLASRDAERMWHLYSRLGLTVWSVTKGSPLWWRRAEYEKDITYVENSELGFDYLRDNLAKTLEERNMLYRPMHYAIIDEVDSILIDEARTPLIISRASDEPTQKYIQYAQLVKVLVPSKTKKKISKWFLAELMKDKAVEEEEDTGGDYYIDEKTKSVTLSSAGIEKLEKMMGVDNLYKDLWYGEIHHIENALKAQAVYNKDKEYLVRDSQVMIVDDHTWRVMPGRRFSQWLHQAIEAKEKVAIQKESKTLASITYQHFFKQYEKLSGMTGTALTEAEEFEKIYEIETVTIPTNKPILRVDKSDQVYFNQKAKRKAVSDAITFYHNVGVPILIGTSSIRTSELVSQILNTATLPHFVLNAKFHEQEANIVKNAWRKWSIVVATNMAWRGTDIKLNPELNAEIAQSYAMRAKNTVHATDAQHVSYVVYSEHEFELLSDALITVFDMSSEEYESSYSKAYRNEHIHIRVHLNKKKKTAEQPFAEIVLKSVHQPAVDMIEKEVHLWLMILGTEKHDSRRIDNQLRWRAGRQGDPGMSQFFVALDDEIMRKMWGDKIQWVAKMMMPLEELEKIAFTQKQFTNSIVRAQKQMEWRHYGIRKHLFEYDSVINKQRHNIYIKRDTILGVASTVNDSPLEVDVLEEVKTFIPELVDELVNLHAAYTPRNTNELIESIQQITAVQVDTSYIQSLGSQKKLKNYLIQQLTHIYEQKIAAGETDFVDAQVKKIYLWVIDKNWMTHIDEMSHLREKVSLWSYAQQDPLIIYKREAYGKYQALLSTIRKETLWYVMRSHFAPIPEQNSDATETVDKLVSEVHWEGVDVMSVLSEVIGNIDMDNLPSQDGEQSDEGTEVIMADGTHAHQISSDDEFEILEIDDDQSTISASNKNVDVSVVQPSSRKLRPNDKVNIRYKDGKMGMDMKWKKVKKLVDDGDAELIVN